MAKAFNPNKPYGTVNGGGFEGYEQNGTIYNAAFQPINFDTRKVLPIDDEPAAAPAASDGALPPAGDSSDEGQTEGADGTLDLDAWMAGDVKYPWPQVQAAVAAKANGQRPKDKEEAKAILLGLNG